MKIVYVLDAIARVGGLERILTDKMNYLAEIYNHDVYLITAIQGTHPYPFPLSSKVKHIDIDARYQTQYKYKYPKRLWVRWKINRRFRINFKNTINNINPDIIIGNTFYKADVICKLKCRAKKIIESHCAKSFTGQNNGICRNKLIQLFYNIHLKHYFKIIQKQSDAIVTLTQGDVNEWETSHKWIIPNIITSLSDTLSCCNKKRVISVGRLSYQKGYDRLIDVWQIVNSKHPDWLLDIYGDGEDETKLRKEIIKKNLNEVINIHPSTSNIYQEMQNSSILALTSRYEGFGLVLIEAMTNGVPCVSFNCPYGPSDIITDKDDGFLIPNGDIQAMADKICYLIEHEEIRKGMGQRAHLAAMRYAPENIMPLWEKLFNEITKS